MRPYIFALFISGASILSCAIGFVAGKQHAINKSKTNGVLHTYNNDGTYELYLELGMAPEELTKKDMVTLRVTRSKH